MAVVFILTQGGPVQHSRWSTTWAYKTGIESGSLGQGAAISLFLLPVLAVVTIAMLLFAQAGGGRRDGQLARERGRPTRIDRRPVRDRARVPVLLGDDDVFKRTDLYNTSTSRTRSTTARVTRTGTSGTTSDLPTVRSSSPHRVPDWLVNTAIVGVCVVAITLVLALPAGYALARLAGPSGQTLGVGIFLTYLVPPTLLFIRSRGDRRRT